MNRKYRYTAFHYVILILTALGASVIGMLLLHSRLAMSTKNIQQSPEKIAQYADGVLRTGSLNIPVSIASTPAQQQQGLSGTMYLPTNAGKLFVFDQPGNYGFWMKDMNYGLDFIWFDSNLKIVTITPNVAASTYPQVFYPSQPISYVLEVNAHFATEHNLKVGEQLTLKKT